jgi:hypothetical protein
VGSSGCGGGTCHLAPRPPAAALPALPAGAGAAGRVATREAIGVRRMTGVPLVPALARGRLDALRVFCMSGGAFALAETGKKLIGERRPPMPLWAI